MYMCNYYTCTIVHTYMYNGLIVTYVQCVPYKGAGEICLSLRLNFGRIIYTNCYTINTYMYYVHVHIHVLCTCMCSTYMYMYTNYIYIL